MSLILFKEDLAMAKTPLLIEMQALMRRNHYAISTEKSYCDWVLVSL